MSKIQKLYTSDFLLMCLANFLMAVAFYFLVSTLPLYLINDLKVPKGQVGTIISIYTLAAILIRPLTGYALDAWNRKWLYVSAFFVFTVFFGFYSLVLSFVPFLLLRFMHGFAWGITTTGGSTSIVDFIPEHRRGEGIGIYGMSFTIAMAFGPFLGLTIIHNFDYTMMFWLATLISLAGFVTLLFIEFPQYHHDHKPKLNFNKLFSRRAFPVSINLLIINITYGALITYITIYAAEKHFENAGTFFIVFAIGIAISRIIAGKIFDRYGASSLGIAGTILIITGFIVLGLAQTYFQFLVSSLINGFGFGVISPTFSTMVNNLVKRNMRGAANSTLFIFLDSGIGIGALVFGFVLEFVNISDAYLICSLLALAGLLFFRFFTLNHYNTHKLTGV